MAEVSVGGVSFKGFGKISALFILASTIISGGWFGFKLWDQWLDLNETVSSIERPDLSYINEEIAVLRSEISTVLEEVSLVNDVASNLSKNINDDIKDLKQDIRSIDKVVNDVEDRVKDTEREISQDLKVIEQELEDKIQKILANPLAGIN